MVSEIKRNRKGRRYVVAGGEIVKLECARCGELKPIEEFTRQRTGFAGRKPRCKPCSGDVARVVSIDEITAVNYQGRLCLTTDQLASAFAVSSNSLYLNYVNNRHLFSEDKHFFQANKESVGRLQKTYPDIFPIKRGYILWTFEGVLTHYSLNTTVPIERIEGVAKKMGEKFDPAYIVAPIRKELIFGDALKKALDGICDVMRQMNVHGYRIDFYLPEVNIAIEYDERLHKYRKEYDKQRQKEIEKVIGCSFIRVSEDEPFETSINRIFKAVIKRKFSEGNNEPLPD